MAQANPIQFRNNSIDMVRILAAGQVAVYHLWSHAPGLSTDNLPARFLTYFPGVPIFFFISGFVITGAWFRDPSPSRYAVSRLFRILPALYACVLFSALAIMLLYQAQTAANWPTFLVWIGAQLALLTSWNPGFLRGYGTGVVNGSLWTIPVEILFYVAAIPMLTLSQSRRGRSLIVLAVLALSLTGNVLAHSFLTRLGLPPVATKIATLSPLSFTIWIWMFCIGALASLWHPLIVPLVVRRFWMCVAAFVLVSAVGTVVEVPGLLRPLGNNVGLLNMLALTAVILGFAFRFPDAGLILKGNDVSYGLYLFHMPVLNAMLALRLTGAACLGGALAGSIVLAVVSWYVIERPCIKLTQRVRRRMRHGASRATETHR